MSNNIREDCGSSKLNYSKKNWDIVCQRYFEKSDFNIKEFYGDVLYVSMGSAYGTRNQSKNVKTTTILEKYPEIIKKYNDTSQNWNIIQGCAYDYEFKDQKFDIIMLDVWAQYICKEEYSILYPKFKKYLKDNGKILIIKTLKTK